MTFKAGQKIKVVDSRKGTYRAIVAKEFEHDNEKTVDQFVSVLLDQDAPLSGIGIESRWYPGDLVPCRTTLALIYPMEGNS